LAKGLAVFALLVLKTAGVSQPDAVLS